jgi:hypothetical protein
MENVLIYIYFDIIINQQKIALVQINVSRSLLHFPAESLYH